MCEPLAVQSDDYSFTLGMVLFLDINTHIDGGWDTIYAGLRRPVGAAQAAHQHIDQGRAVFEYGNEGRRRKVVGCISSDTTDCRSNTYRQTSR